MDLLSTLTLFATILGIGAFVGGGLAYLFAHDKLDPARHLKRTIITLGTLGALGLILVLQYEQAPESSLLTLVPGVPFPHATVTACHVTVDELPHGTPIPFKPAVATPGIAGQSLLIRGGSALSIPIATAAKSFDAVNSTHTTVKASNSSRGIEDTYTGDADIGLSGSFKESDPGALTSHYYATLDDYMVAVVPFTLIVSADLRDAIQNLTERQLIDIYDGRITNWHAVGGPAEDITVVNRTAGSATRDAFEKYVTHSKPRQGVGVDEDGTDQVLTLVQQTPGAIGYVATTSLIRPPFRTTVFPVCIDGVGATKSSILSGKYSFWSVEHLYARHDPPRDKQLVIQSFLQFVCDEHFKADVLAGNGFLRIRDLPPETATTRGSQEKVTITECTGARP